MTPGKADTIPSPMLDQYRRIKRDHQGEVLFFRLGDFYEMFADDALEISSLLNLTLTSRGGQPMCGIPYHAARSYIARLLKLGKKIAVCEQLTEPGKKLIERRVVEVITPGTTVDEDYLDKGSSNYLCCLAVSGSSFSFAYIDLSAGDFFATSFFAELSSGGGSAGSAEKIRQELERLDAREIIVQESLLNEFPFLAGALKDRPGLVINRWADWLFDRDRSRQRLLKQFGTASLKGFGLEENSAEITAAGALLDYLDETAKSLIPHIKAITVYEDSQYMGIDESTQRNLELIKNLRNGDSSFTLLEVMDETRTAMGRRLLKTRILHPLRNTEQINFRLDLVDLFYHNQEKLGRMRELLGKTGDLERLSSRIAMDRAHGKDMAGVKNTLVYFFKIEEECSGCAIRYESPEAFFTENGDNAAALERLKELAAILDSALPEDPSILLTEGNLIRSGYDSNLDRLHQLRDNGRKLLEDYLEEEKQNTGISSLKIRYNRMIGYFFEVTKNQLSKVPSHFIRRQGITTGERYTTDRLAELESDINGASDKIIELEKKLFLEIREKAKAMLRQLRAAARRIAELDAAVSAARAASIYGWVRPVVNEKKMLRIIEGRHPVVEAHLGRGEFIPNDVILDAESPQNTGIVTDKGAGSTGQKVFFALITGPNMAGKSTYLRQAALITIMAQAGSFVPASEADIGMCDRIYCRVGASDNLARGESTFLVEMNETAYILRSATEKSLIIMVEVGRGTGTKDGLSIAWAVTEEILNRIKCRTLFATHFHELSEMSHPGMANRSMEVKQSGNDVIFLRKLKDGPAAESFGLYVAHLAGLPEPVLERAAQIMDTLGKNTADPVSLEQQKSAFLKAETKAEKGLKKKDEPVNFIIQELSDLDINTLSPLDALNLVAEWKDKTLENLQLSGRKSDSGSGRKQGILRSANREPGLFD
ncbi:MAG: DNA mismatch repair protein MutS [Treponema sp.]|nr:DNA mismatch repair protein MutS [Treponema sp.]